ncbi:MFS transporter [Pseudoxanthomonas beigongshangi]|uniref:MFS transporter n=1 Tax=Pseudoxanthomonas beigongshangi TaxID=2782537 RepID=UPI00193C3354|nr:MFS transporter [Pseudoxanthomonas beigongshangi]
MESSSLSSSAGPDIAADPAPAITTTAEDGLLSPRRRAMTLGMVALVSLGAFEALAVATAMPTVARALDGLSLYALAFAGTLAASVVGMVHAGRASDRHGPTRVVWWGVAWFVAGLIVAGLAPNMPVLLLGRVVQGFGGGAMSVALYVVVARAYPEALRPRVFAAFSAAWVVPSLIGPSVSGLIVEHVGWRWVFLAVPLLAIPAAWALRPGLKALPPTIAETTGGRSLLPWAGLAAAAACALHLAGQRHDARGALLLAVALMGLIWATRKLLPDGSLSLRRGLPSVIALRGLASATFFGAEVFIPLMLAQQFKLSPLWAGVALSVGALGWSMGSWYQGNTRRAWSRATLLRIGLTMMAIGILPLPLAVFLPGGLGLALVGWAITGIGMGLTYPSLSVLTLSLSPPQAQGRNSSALQLMDALAIATVLALAGSLVAALLDRAPTLAFGLSFGMTVVLAVLGALLAGRVRPAD